MPDISADIAKKLQAYEVLLQKWQRSINLVSGATLKEAKKRHFDDSLQLLDYIPELAKVFDLGSGAGFPGLVLAIARPDIDVTLIESDQKKCTFLSTVSRETEVPVKVINQRIESAATEIIPDIITARALASLDKLMGYCLPWIEKNADLRLVFLKGENADSEIAEASRNYGFKAEKVPSRTGDGHIVLLSEIGRKTGV